MLERFGRRRALWSDKLRCSVSVVLKKLLLGADGKFFEALGVVSLREA